MDGGVGKINQSNPYVPTGLSVFEIGTNFVFVTPRIWTAASKWESAKKKERKWKSVRVLTAVELEDWLSQCPSVAVWLTSIIKRNFDLRIDSIEDFWKKWSVNEDGMTLNYLVSNSTDESLAFLAASILETRVDYLISHYESAGRGEQVVKILYHVIEYKDQYPLDLNYVVNTMKRVLPILDPEKLGLIRFELNGVMEWIDKQSEVSETDVVALEMPYILMSGEEISDWRIYKMIIESPHYLFEMIDYAFYSDDPEQRKLEEERNTSDKQRRVLATFSGRLLLSIHTMPCMDGDDAIDEERLREYIATLQKLGSEKKKMSMVNHTIGKLLANCPQCIQGCPPEIICEIIEGLNNKSVNNSFYAQIYNRLGSTVRGPYDGGDIEYNKAARFHKTAEKLQIMYPITSEIFRDLSDVYMKEAKRHDTEVEIMKLDN